jgi:hypothetical protein
MVHVIEQLASHVLSPQEEAQSTLLEDGMKSLFQDLHRSGAAA